jgi:hypothetical protein
MPNKIKSTSKQTGTVTLVRDTKRKRIVLLLIIATLVIGTGLYVSYAYRNAQYAYDSASLQNAETNTTQLPQKSSIDTEMSEAPAASDSVAEAIAPREYFFVDTSGWVTKNSRDGAFSVKYISDLVYETCPDLSDNLMTAIAGPADGVASCGSTQKAVTYQPSGADAIALFTQTILAQTDERWERGSAVADEVTLVGGHMAKRYEYETTVLDKQYRTVEYETVVNGKRYLAINNWEAADGPNTPVNEFDTMVQKTWSFN